MQENETKSEKNSDQDIWLSFKLQMSSSFFSFHATGLSYWEQYLFLKFILHWLC